MTRPPSIVYLHSHDTGRYVRPFGHDVPTPNIQALAADGMLCRQAYSAAPTCSPSRAALLTGQYPHTNGMLGLAHRGFALYDYRRHLVHTLRAAGYYSAAVGVQHIARRTVRVGYDAILGAASRCARDVASAAAAFLTRPPDRPFFLSVGFWETHREFPPPGTARDPRYCLPPPTLPDTPAIRADVAGFEASLQALDEGVGQVLRALDGGGGAGETLVIFTTDHGPPFPGMKCTLTDHGIGVTLVLRGPGGFTGGRVCDALVSHVDLFPTLCELLGISAPGWLQGTSLLPVVRGDAAEVRDQVFAEINYHAAYEPQRAVRTRRYKYIRRFDGRTRPVLANTDDSPGKDLWLASGWRDRAVAPEQLYDLVFDPGEACNVAESPTYAAALLEMRARLERWMTDTHDPLLTGRLPVPAGAVANDPDQVSPGEPVRPVS